MLLLQVSNELLQLLHLLSQTTNLVAVAIVGRQRNRPISTRVGPQHRQSHNQSIHFVSPFVFTTVAPLLQPFFTDTR
jgi:hypothetical protein